MAHVQKLDFVLLRLKYDGTCAETRFCLTAFEMWWHMRRNQISSYCVWRVMAHAEKPDFVLLRLKCDGTCTETRFRLTAFEMWWHMRWNQISSSCVWSVMAHAQNPDFVLLRLKCDGTCAETRFRLTAFEMWLHMCRNQISSYCVWNVMAHAQKPDFVSLRLKCDGTCAETRFRLITFEMWWHTRRNQISSFGETEEFFWIGSGVSVQSTTGSRSVHMCGSNAGYIMFRGSVKGTGYPLHSSVSPSLPLSCVTVCHYVPTGHLTPYERDAHARSERICISFSRTQRMPGHTYWMNIVELCHTHISLSEFSSFLAFP